MIRKNNCCRHTALSLPAVTNKTNEDDKASWPKDKPETKASRFFQPGTCWYLTKIGVERNAKGNIKITILFTATEGGQCDSQKSKK